MKKIIKQDEVLKEWSAPVNLKKMSAKERRFYFFCKHFARRLRFKNLRKIGLKRLILELTMYLDLDSTGEMERLLRERFESYEAMLKEEEDRVFAEFEKI